MHSPPVNSSEILTSHLRASLLLSLLLCLPFHIATSQELSSNERILAASTDLPPTTPPLPGLGHPLPLSLADAVALTLQKNQNIALQREVVIETRGTLQEATGAFDATVVGQFQGSYNTSDNNEDTSYNDYSLLSGSTSATGGFISNVEDALSLQIAVQKMFRNGISLIPQVTVTDDLTQMTGESTNSTEGFLGFTLEIPLAAGLGYDNLSAATERAYAIEVAAQVSTLEYTIAEQLSNTISAYWGLLLAQTNVRIARSNESAAQRLIEITEALIQGFVEPAIQLAQARANLEQYTAQRIAAEQSQSQASQQLAVALGFLPRELLHEPLAIDPFPIPKASDRLTPDMIDELIELALERRADVRSDRQMIASNRSLVTGAENNALPEVDLLIGGGLQQSTTRENFTGGTFRDTQQGAAIAATISVSWPIENNVAKGALVQSRSQLNQARLEASLLESQVASDVITAAKSVILMREALDEAVAGARDALTSVQAQQTLFTMGMTSLTEVITTQTNLANAQLTVATYQSNYASAVLQLRFATGTLLPTRDPRRGYQLDLSSLARLPRR